MRSLSRRDILRMSALTVSVPVLGTGSARGSQTTETGDAPEAVHMVRVVIGPQSSWPLADANAAVEDWMSKQSEWTADTVEHSLSGASDPDGTADWWSGGYRLTFESDPKDNLLQKLEDKLVNKCDWYRIGYHECDHSIPSNERTGCSWNDQSEWSATGVTIDDAVPTFVEGV